MIYLTLGIFFLTFALIIFEAYDKSILALLGALLMVILGIISPDEAIGAIEFETILLLLSMMILVNIASKSGIFDWLNVKIASLTRGNPLAIFLLFSAVTMVFSAILDNVTTVILIVPLTIQLVRGMGKDPKPYIIAEMIFSNIGGAMTLIGDPSNILIGGASGYNFLEFLKNLWIPTLLSAVFAVLAIVIFNWKKLRPISDDLVDLCIANVTINKIKHKYSQSTIHKDFVLKVVAVLVLTIVGFLAQSLIGLPTYVIAFAAAMLLGLLCSKRVDMHVALSSVEWTTLFFFAGLFIMVRGVEETGLLQEMSHWITGTTDDIFYLSLIILWMTGIISMLLDNIPFVTVMIPVIIGMQAHLGADVDSSVLWWALSLGACLGGNGTLVGASANVVSAGLAKKEGVNISFLGYLKFGLPMTFGFLLISSGYLFFRLN